MVGAVIVAAGRGERLGTDVPKGFVSVDDVPLMLLCIPAFESATTVSEIVLVVPSGFERKTRELCSLYRFAKVKHIVAGGMLRQDSVAAGVNALDRGIDHVLVHDGARPFITRDIIDDCATSVIENRSIVVGTNVTDTLHERKENYTHEGPDRSKLIAVQTPQGFHRQTLLDAFSLNNTRNIKATDEVTLVRNLCNIPAKIVLGRTTNLKITHPEDMDFYLPQLEKLAIEVKESS